MKEQKKISNKKKKAVKPWKKTVIFILAQVFLVTAVLLAYNVVAGSRIKVETRYGNYSYQVDPFARKDKFEETHIFDSMFQAA